MPDKRRSETPMEAIRRTTREINTTTAKLKELRAERIDAMRRAVADGVTSRDVADASEVTPEYVSGVAPRNRGSAK